MKLWILSDLHLTRQAARAGSIRPDAMPDADVAVIAGDVTEGVIEAIDFLARTISLRMPVVAVLGNHEFYGQEYREARLEARRVSELVSGLHLLDDGEAIIGGVRFIGGTLWTDYSIYADDDPRRVRSAMAVARQMLSDHARIEVRRGETYAVLRDWAPSDALRAHDDTVAFLDRSLGVRHSGRTVVVTHHAPHVRCVARKYEGHALTPAFVSDLSEMIERRRPDLWVHGHVHDRVDFQAGGTRIVCNPRGYAGERTEFDQRLIVEL